MHITMKLKKKHKRKNLNTARRKQISHKEVGSTLRTGILPTATETSKEGNDFFQGAECHCQFTFLYLLKFISNSRNERDF